MKKKTIKTYLSIIFLVGIFVTLNSCSSDNEFDFNNESSIINEDIAILSKGYADLFNDIVKATLEENEKISNSNVEINKEEFAKKITSSCINRLTPEQNKLLYRTNSYKTRSGDQANEAITIPNEFKKKIECLLFVDDPSLLIYEIDKFYNSQYFFSLDCKEQQELKIQLETLKITRDYMVEIIIDHFQNENATTRSPGDRMVMSAAAKNLNGKQLDKCIQATLAVTSIVAPGGIGVAATLIALALTLFS